MAQWEEHLASFAIYKETEALDERGGNENRLFWKLELPGRWIIHLLSINLHPQRPRDHETVFRSVPFPSNTPHNETQHNTLPHLLPATTNPRIRSKTYSLTKGSAQPRISSLLSASPTHNSPMCPNPYFGFPGCAPCPHLLMSGQST